MELKSTSFRTGKVYLSSKVTQRKMQHPRFKLFIEESLQKYKSSNWGNSSRGQKMNNDTAEEIGNRIKAVYNIPVNLQRRVGAKKIWIISEHDEETTTVLFPSEF